MSNNENKLTKWIVGPPRRASRSKRETFLCSLSYDKFSEGLKKKEMDEDCLVSSLAMFNTLKGKTLTATKGLSYKPK